MITLYDERDQVIGTIETYSTINGRIREVVLHDGRKMRFGPGEIIRDDAYSYHVCKSPYCSKSTYDYSRQSTERAKKNDIVRFGMCNVCIRKVIFNDPATIIFWSDGTKTVVKCGPEDTYDMEKGLAMAIVKKMAGNGNRFHKVFKQWRKPKDPLAVHAVEAMVRLVRAAAKAERDE